MRNGLIASVMLYLISLVLPAFESTGAPNYKEQIWGAVVFATGWMGGFGGILWVVRKPLLVARLADGVLAKACSGGRQRSDRLGSGRFGDRASGPDTTLFSALYSDPFLARLLRLDGEPDGAAGGGAATSENEAERSLISPWLDEVCAAESRQEVVEGFLVRQVRNRHS